MNDEAENSKPKRHWGGLLLSALFLLPAIHFAIQGDVILAAACVIVGLAASAGYRAGAIATLALFAAAAAAITYAPSLGLDQEWRFARWFGTSGLTNRLVSVIVIGLLIGTVVMGLVGIVTRRMMVKRPGLETWDRRLGFALGAVEGAISVALLLGGLLVIEPLDRRLAQQRDPNNPRGQAVSNWIQSTTAKTRSSRLGPTLVDYNPFVRIPALNQFEEIQRSVQILASPSRMQDLLNHPAIQDLQQSPEMRRAMTELQKDPEIEEILNSGRPIDGKAVITLMNHPAVLELIDQPGFMEQAKAIIQDPTWNTMTGP